LNSVTLPHYFIFINQASKAIIMAKSVLNQIGDIYDHSCGCSLDQDFFVKADKDLELLSEYFSVSKHQTLMISVIISLQYNRNTVSMTELINHF
jgi:hypothetical protein